MIRGKTAELFAAACEVGPVIAERPRPEQAACRAYGMNLGIAFQLVDDVLDYGGTSAALGKNVGDDFREGKITLPVVLAFRRGDEEERAFWRRTLEQGEVRGRRPRDRPRDHAPPPRARGHGRARARHYGAHGARRARPVPEQPDEAALLQVVDFCVSRVALIRVQPSRRLRRSVSAGTVAFTHQPGCWREPMARRARASAACQSSNRPNTVAPEPDMRASRQPGESRRRVSAVADHRRQR